ncbi:unnamed protein product [Nezara viridula]|uniref:F5/8 type C domain-containing protein n=1 Tax=Nezara viridula TaxID=85310 RepID=A0A9P0E582_NEZVI|nr:unnamed protein product [Nezara viridula]
MEHRAVVKICPALRIPFSKVLLHVSLILLRLRWILSGNSDTATVVSHKLMPPVFANQIRVLPYSVHRRTVCLRIELLGCPFTGKA